MKRTALARYTPLRRSWMKRKPRRDPVPEWLRPYIGARDRQCVLATLDPEHVCRDQFGNRIAPDGQWEMDHIDNGGVGRRVHSKVNAVRLCPSGHVAKTHNASKYRPLLRAYALRVEGEEAA